MYRLGLGARTLVAAGAGEIAATCSSPRLGSLAGGAPQTCGADWGTDDGAGALHAATSPAPSKINRYLMPLF